MKILFVNACVSDNSRTEMLCRYYLEKQYSENDTIMECCLSELSLQPENQAGINQRMKDCENKDFSSSEYDYAKQFAMADEILIGAPYWDCSFPSILKIYFEHICVNGITFEYGENGTLVKLCNASKLVYITTAGGYIQKQNSVRIHISELCNMFGIREFRFYTAEGLDICSNNVNEILERAKAELRIIPDEQFVRVRDFISDIAVELRYAGSMNFTGKKIYDFTDAWLRYGTVKKLEKAQEILKNQGYGLKIWDAFRPISAQFVLWEVCPDSTYVADPIHGFSDHSRGNTVDVTIIDNNGNEIVMPTLFDSFSKQADRDYRDVPNKEAVVNSWMLQETMIEAGFIPYEDEWWHFSDKDTYEPEKEFCPEKDVTLIWSTQKEE